MLGRMFWPKEVKELVSKYRAEGVLNIVTLQGIDKRIKRVMLLTGVYFITIGIAAAFEGWRIDDYAYAFKFFLSLAFLAPLVPIIKWPVYPTAIGLFSLLSLLKPDVMQRLKYIIYILFAFYVIPNLYLFWIYAEFKNLRP